MDKLKLHTPDLAAENFRKLAALFPNAVTETINEAGEVVRAIDADVLRQEISATVVEGPQERYQFTWPDKKKSVVLANAPIAKTLRLDRSRSMGRDGTRGSIDSGNIYIEGDNLDALKLLQETYLGKVKMIYIDPPYNTGNDFIYNDDFSMETEEYASASGQLDEEGNRLVQNSESNGRFHTDWLNMLYPRLRIAKDFLSDDGVIFISIDDNEVENLRKICDEIFGRANFVAQQIWEKKFAPQNDDKYITAVHDYILVYAKQKETWKPKLQKRTDEALKKFKNLDNDERGVWTSGDLTSKTKAAGHSYAIISPSGKEFYPPAGRQWAPAYETYLKLKAENRLWFGENGDNVPRQKQFLSEIQDGVVPTTIMFHSDCGHNQEAKKELISILSKIGNGFETPKPTRLLKKLMNLVNFKEGDIVFDFFSGSATTAHAVMQLNTEDGGSRKFIMVQLPEVTGEKSEARKAGYETICDIGEERIRRAGDKIRAETGVEIDYGFRVFRVDTTNMEDVYYSPAETTQEMLAQWADNIKPDRTPEDLLFQVMLDLGILLSSSIEETVIAGKKVFSVAGGYLLACFDQNVTEETVTEIAKRHPFYAVFRDSSMANDSVATNFEQIFATYSPKTVRKVL
ncbi:site-specific DNA-methyltransferase [Pseudoflavonifractor sp. 60]|uniref:site-specific DNA-methyltransferase n=1 Tax=Pseudoflavonifractor sp. 60 TaxID=2304576 RepID=UPI001370F898|nr:DNA methyltransferase [Pseudoflavonifractor sp. 60]NBI68109.1 site-specific DNA-methyltransferase [Pseudoflavonifractor sp. 60]